MIFVTDIFKWEKPENLHFFEIKSEKEGRKISFKNFKCFSKKIK